MKVEDAQNIFDLRDMAKRRLPKWLFEFVDRGTEDEVSLRHNFDALKAIRLRPRTLVDVSERTQEMGIRLALGADRPTILKLVLGQGVVLIAIGLTAGLAGAVILTRTLSGLVYGVGTLDPVTFVAVPALLCAIALVACVIPARRAASVDPITTLRQS